jgi:hypothetical protein
MERRLNSINEASIDRPVKRNAANANNKQKNLRIMQKREENMTGGSMQRFALLTDARI